MIEQPKKLSKLIIGSKIITFIFCSASSGIMSSIAAEGMFGAIEVNEFVEDNAKTFVQKAIELYANSNTWKKQQQLGFEVLSNRFNKIDFESDFSFQLKTLQSNLKAHRQNNFIGIVLQHQTLQSTK